MKKSFLYNSGSFWCIHEGNIYQIYIKKLSKTKTVINLEIEKKSYSDEELFWRPADAGLGGGFKIYLFGLVWHLCASKVGKLEQGKVGQFMQTKLLSNKLYSTFLFVKF